MMFVEDKKDPYDPLGLQQESAFDKLLKEREAQGWHYIGSDVLTETRYEDGLFQTKQVRTKEQLKDKYEKSFDPSEEAQIDLVAQPGEVVDGVELPNKSQTYYIFAKTK